MNATKVLNLDATERLDCECNGEKFWIEAKAETRTSNFRQALIHAGEDPKSVVTELANFITDWNVFLHKEGDFPPTAENIGNMPEDFAAILVSRILETWTGDKKKQKASANG